MSRARYHFDNYYGDSLVLIGDAYRLFQTGDIDCNPGHGVGEHAQCVHEISYVVSGSGSMWIDGEEIAVTPGMAVINRIGDRHRILAAADTHLRFFYIGFLLDDESEAAWSKTLRAFYENPPVRVIADASALHEAFVELFNEILYRDAVSDAMVESCMHRILCGVYRMATRAQSPGYTLGRGDMVDQRFIYDVIHYIDSHAQESGLLSRIGAEFGYNYDYISRRFSAVTGQNMRDYYNARRFEKACDYLREGLSVTAAAERLGYESIHAFSGAFKKRVGVSPSTYRNRAVSSNETAENKEKSEDD